MNPGAGNASKQYFLYDHELANSVISEVRIYDRGIAEISNTIDGGTTMALAQMDNYVVTFVNDDNVVLIDSMPLLNFLWNQPYSANAYEQLPTFNMRFSPEKSYISTSDGSGLGAAQIIPFTFSFKRLL